MKTNRKSMLLSMLVLLLAPLLLLGWSGKQYSSTSMKKNESVKLAKATAKPAMVEIVIKDMSYSPTTLTVKKGEKVVWMNKGTVAHTVTGGTAPNGDGSFNQTIEPGKSYSHIFHKAGTFPYFCKNDNAMTGTITVTE
jgi:plastocyanin